MAYYLGLISGTSMDGVDAALVDVATDRIALHTYAETPYPPALGSALEALVTRQQTGLAALGRLHAAIGHAFADAATRLLATAGVAASEVRAIGSHGQTIVHGADADPPFSLQIGDPSIVAWRTGVTTVADFRTKDLAAGGQGAPLVPPFHAACLGPRIGGAAAVVNLGGIANATLLPATTGAPVTAFDTGPANTLLDAWCRRHRGESCDRDGRWAATGRALPALLARLLADPYFARPAPKSTGREYFHLAWLDRHLAAVAASAPAVDVQATLVELTAASVAQAVRAALPDCERVVLCGGGSRNPVLVAALGRALAPLPLARTDDYGLPGAAVEAAAFAWLAARRLALEPGNLPACTGAAKPVVLGAIYAPG